MDYSLEPSADGNYIIITVTGEFTRTEAAEITVAAQEMGAALGINCYLNDATQARNTETALENVRFTQDYGPESPAFPDACTALLLDPSDRSHDFYLAFAKTAGVDITPFWDREKAIAHLLEAASGRNNKPPS